jgi:hypothetical protein
MHKKHQANIQALSRIPTCDLGNHAASDLHLRLHSQRDQFCAPLREHIFSYLLCFNTSIMSYCILLGGTTQFHLVCHFYEYHMEILTWEAFPITYKRSENNHYWVYLIWIRLSRKRIYAGYNNVMERECFYKERTKC